MKFLLFDKEENLIGTLKDVFEAKHTEEINGEDVLELATLDQSINKGHKVAYRSKYGYWNEFVVKGIEEEHSEEGIIKTVFCESSFYETLGDYIEDKRPYDVTSNVALAVALEPTRWKVGIVDDLGISSTNFYHLSAKEAVQKIAEAWQGEVRTRIVVSGNKITHRYVDLLAQRGHDLGRRFTYTKHLESIAKTVHREDVITALYGYGKGEEIIDDEGDATGGFGRRISFRDINGGKAYVENNEARLIWGRNNPNGTKAHVFGKVEFDDCEDPQELLELTKEKLGEISCPLVTYEAKVIDLGGAELGDAVAVIDKEFTPELRLKARVVKIVRDLLEEENNDIILGNFIPNITDTLNEYGNYIDNFRSRQGIWDRSQIISNDGTINAQFLNNLVDEMNKRMNAQGGYVFISEEGEGLITYDKPNPEEATMAIQLLGGAFRIAGSKKPNGEFDFRTFGDGNGFVADAFIGGLLKGGKVHFDLTNGTLLIGNSPSDYSLYWDGSTLNIRGNVDISSNQTVKDLQDDLSGVGNEIDRVKNGTYTKTDVDAKFNAQAGEISNKVSSTTYTAGIRDAKSYAESQASQAENNAKSYATNLFTPLETRVKTAEQKITPEKIISTVTDSTTYKEDRKGMEEIIKGAKSTLEQTARSLTFTVENIQVGGQNIFKNSSDEYKTLNPGIYYSAIAEGPKRPLSEYGLKPGDEIIYRLYMRAPYYYGGRARITYWKSSDGMDYNTATGEVIGGYSEGYSTVKLTIPDDAVEIQFSIQNQNSGGDYNIIHYKEAKLEKGNKPTDWSPHSSELKGATYNFDGDKFSIGGRSGDRAEHTNAHSKYTHSDGSYTQIGSRGLERYISGSGKHYHYLLSIQTFTFGESSSNARWVTLPSEFRGKNFQVYFAIADSLNVINYKRAIQRFVCTRHPDHSIDYANARVPVIAYKSETLSDGVAPEITSVQGMLIAIY